MNCVSKFFKTLVVSFVLLSTIVFCAEASTRAPKKKHMKFNTIVDIAPDETELTREELLLLDLHMLVGKGNLRTLKKIAKLKKDFFRDSVNKPIKGTERTMLMEALDARYGSARIIKVADFLIKNGALIGCKDVCNETCLHIAVHSGKFRLVRYVLEKFYEGQIYKGKTIKEIENSFNRFLLKRNNDGFSAYDIATKKWPQNEYGAEFIKRLEMLNGNNQHSFELFKEVYDILVIEDATACF